jgi:hypothetical protein
MIPSQSNGTSAVGQIPSSISALNAPSAAPSRPAPKSSEVQDALATITAATAVSVSAGGASNIAMPMEHPIEQSETRAPAGGGNRPIVVYMECDEESLSEYQCLLRKQIELFEA